ncbi:MAG: AbrB family transcriptional regulator [Paraburkholderia sp.]|uniref:AbrB/MazE/SpoVT family DNA-binding domain-containing protein n=1 Tax=Paraburkholderia sp. TaxID=1926495 RepID=UPI0011F9CFF1|nr:AbrB/MazE/SpoVT family DNA-binding domain-containing protein [Paraburkholderia sp.]TAL92926.1 MAG: AbrB family transcriptional regulator [Paraburkholderia sp.]
MASATITSKGRITIPVGVRSDLGLITGDRIGFVLNETTGRYELVPVTESVESLKGLVGKPTRPVSVEDMNAAIAACGTGAK